jgi:2-polyprenyl-6-methoxyphenol hydroxylase-like FAD-dependent oxidoreductase
VVVGGGLAGMLAARVLADHFDRVTVLERDRVPEMPASRKGRPRARPAHVGIARGGAALEQLLPGLTDDLVRAGASPDDLGEAVAWLTPFGWGRDCRAGLPLLSRNRDLIDGAVRRRVAALPNVRFRQGVEVTGLLAAPSGRAAVGVRLRAPCGDRGESDREERLAADLVAVADGRNARLPGWTARLMASYVARVIRLSARHAGVRRRLLEVMSLLRPPSALLGPGILVRVAWAWLTGAADEASPPERRRDPVPQR